MEIVSELKEVLGENGFSGLAQNGRDAVESVCQVRELADAASDPEEIEKGIGDAYYWHNHYRDCIIEVENELGQIVPELGRLANLNAKEATQHLLGEESDCESITEEINELISRQAFLTLGLPGMNDRLEDLEGQVKFLRSELTAVEVIGPSLEGLEAIKQHIIDNLHPIKSTPLPLPNGLERAVRNAAAQLFGSDSLANYMQGSI
jgi:hypothetical protein